MERFFCLFLEVFNRLCRCIYVDCAQDCRNEGKFWEIFLVRMSSTSFFSGIYVYQWQQLEEQGCIRWDACWVNCILITTVVETEQKQTLPDNH